MRTYALAIFGLIVAGCGGNGTTTVTPSSTPPSDNGGGGSGGNGGGGGGGGSPGGGGGMPGGGGGGSGGMPGGGGSGGVGGGGSGGSGGGGGGAMIPPCTTTPTRIAQLPYHAAGVAVDDANAYVSAHHDNTNGYDTPVDIWAVPLAGGAPRVLGSVLGGSLLPGMTVNATAVFYDEDTRIMRIAKDGSGATAIAKDNFGLCLADAGGDIWWCDSYGVFHAPEDGGPTAQATDTGYAPMALAFDAHDLFTAFGATVWRVPGRSGAPVVVTKFNNGASVEALAADDNAIFIGSGSSVIGGDIWSLDKSGTSPPRRLAHNGFYVVSMFADGGNVYWWGTAEKTAYIGRVGKDGSNFTILMEQPFTVRGFTVRGDSVYFVSESDDGVYRLCK